jgi:acyl-CoA reductase-like NAD-dependent aldehyde dehydrogenase
VVSELTFPVAVDSGAANRQPRTRDGGGDVAINSQLALPTPLRAPERLFIGGSWLPAASGSTIDVIDSATEQAFLSVAEAGASDMSRAVAAAREAFDRGPWPRLTHLQRAEYLTAIGQGLRRRTEDLGQYWVRESGSIYSRSRHVGVHLAEFWDMYADYATTFPFEAPMTRKPGEFGLLVREPVGVVGAIIPWNGPLGLITFKVAPALLAGCTIVLKLSPEAPAAGYLLAEIAEDVGLPPGVLNVVTADREVSELLVRDARVDKVTFTGSTAAGRRVGSIMGERIGRFTLELGGKSAAVILDDADIPRAANVLATAGCSLSGQVCSALTRVIVSRHRHAEMLESLAESYGSKRVGDPFDPATELGPVASERQRAIVESYIAQGRADGATLAAGGGRPAHLERGFYIEPTVFGNVDNGSTIAQEEIFGPVLSVIPADSEEHAIALANASIYGLNASVFTADVERARAVAGQLRVGTVGHNGYRNDWSIAFGGFKQSGVGREGGLEGLGHFLETKTVILDGPPSSYQ